MSLPKIEKLHPDNPRERERRILEHHLEANTSSKLLRLERLREENADTNIYSFDPMTKREYLKLYEKKEMPQDPVRHAEFIRFRDAIDRDKLINKKIIKEKEKLRTLHQKREEGLSDAFKKYGRGYKLNYTPTLRRPVTSIV